MSDTKSKLDTEFKALEVELEATVMRSGRVLEQHGFALDTFRDNDLERLNRYGDCRLEVGVQSERVRVFKLWKEIHSAIIDYSKAYTGSEMADAIIKRVLILGEEILDIPDMIPQVAEHDPVEPRPQDGDLRVAAPTEDVLMSKVVKLMAKAGTRRHGLKAGWTIEEIQYGLMVAMPGVPDDAVESALARLKSEGVVEAFNNNNPGVHIYCLVDDYADRMGVDSEQAQEEPEVDFDGELLQGLQGVLQSNTGANGKLVPWKLGSLFYALRDQHPWITKADVAAAASAAQWCEEVTPGVYRWAEVESMTAQVVESVEPEPVKKQPVGVVEAADAIYGVLKAEAASGQRRIWKEYDILGFLGRGVELGGNLRAEHLSQGLLNAAINFLVVEGRLEVVPPSPERPWIKQPGWRVAR
jgi:hypothetical protein